MNTTQDYNAVGFKLLSHETRKIEYGIHISFLCEETHTNHTLRGTIKGAETEVQFTCPDCKKEMRIQQLCYPKFISLPQKIRREDHSITYHIKPKLCMND